MGLSLAEQGLEKFRESELRGIRGRFLQAPLADSLGPPETWIQEGLPVQDIQVTPSQDRAAVLFREWKAPWRQRIRILDLDQDLRVLGSFVLEGNRWGTSHLSFSPEGRFLATRGVDSIRVWDLTQGKKVHAHSQKSLPPWGAKLFRGELWAGLSMPYLGSRQYLVRSQAFGKRTFADQLRSFQSFLGPSLRPNRVHQSEAALAELLATRGIVDPVRFHQDRLDRTLALDGSETGISYLSQGELFSQSEDLVSPRFERVGEFPEFRDFQLDRRGFALELVRAPLGRVHLLVAGPLPGVLALRKRDPQPFWLSRDPEVTCARFSPSGSLVLFGTSRGEVSFRRLRAEASLPRLGARESVPEWRSMQALDLREASLPKVSPGSLLHRVPRPEPALGARTLEYLDEEIWCLPEPGASSQLPIPSGELGHGERIRKLGRRICLFPFSVQFLIEFKGEVHRLVPLPSRGPGSRQLCLAPFPEPSPHLPALLRQEAGPPSQALSPESWPRALEEVAAAPSLAPEDLLHVRSRGAWFGLVQKGELEAVHLHRRRTPSPEPTILRVPGRVRDFAFSPKGTRVAILTVAGELFVFANQRPGTEELH